MEVLPDDILLLVFRLLDTQQLVREVRAVCRRWRELALHGYAWSHRRLETQSSAAPDANWAKFVSRVLNVAPCLHELRLPRPSVLTLEKYSGLTDILKNTACSAESVTLHVPRIESQLSITEEILKNQVALGRIRELRIHINDGADLRNTLAAVGDIHLNSLVLEGYNNLDVVPPNITDVWGRGSLRSLWYRYPRLDLLEFLLRNRCHSLESVCLYNRNMEASGAFVCDLLASRCEKLRTAYFNPIGVGFQHLIDSPSITSLGLLFKRVDADLLTAAGRYFRSPAGARLTTLHLGCIFESGECSCALVLECVSALALGVRGDRRRSALQDLCLILCPATVADQLAVALRGLPHLCSLQLRGNHFAVLYSPICAGLAPSLRTLTLFKSSPLTPEERVQLTDVVRRSVRLEVRVLENVHWLYSSGSLPRMVGETVAVFRHGEEQGQGSS